MGLREALREKVLLATKRSNTCRFILEARKRFYAKAGEGDWSDEQCEKNNRVAISAVGEMSNVRLEVHGIINCADCADFVKD